MLMKKIHKPVRAICQRGEKIVLTWCKRRVGVGGWVVCFLESPTESKLLCSIVFETCIRKFDSIQALL